MLPFQLDSPFCGHADLAERMQESGGKIFWASPECWLMLDTAHAKKGALVCQQGESQLSLPIGMPEWQRLWA